MQSRAKCNECIYCIMQRNAITREMHRMHMQRNAISECSCNAVVMQAVHANAKNAMHGQKPHAFWARTTLFPPRALPRERRGECARVRAAEWRRASLRPELGGGDRAHKCAGSARQRLVRLGSASGSRSCGDLGRGSGCGSEGGCRGCRV